MFISVLPPFEFKGSFLGEVSFFVKGGKVLCFGHMVLVTAKERITIVGENYIHRHTREGFSVVFLRLSD